MGGGALRRPLIEVQMLKHRYAAGDRVMAVASTSNQDIPPGVYTIARTLPVAGWGCQYRARNALDMHERVLDEDLLQRAHG
jgi:hypothetical protein